jgi:hypothetical protein
VPLAVAVASDARVTRPPRLGGLLQAAADAPFLTSLVVCVALAALSAAVLPTVPSYDPWSWIVWGHEATDPHLNFTVAGGPSWKPLPVLFTTVYGLFGGASPTLWVMTARFGGLMGLVAAYRLAARVVRGDGVRWAPACAGVLAATGVALTQDFAYYMFRGTSEPMLVGCSLWAIDRHLEGRHRSAFALGVAASLIRPEAWPFIGLYAIWLWLRSDTKWRVYIVLGLFSIPFFWFGPPWVGTGQPFIAASHAKDYNGHLGSDPFVTVVHRGEDLQVLPAFVFGLIAIALAWFRRQRDRLVLGLALAAAGWWVLVIGMTLDGYPGLERFYLPAAGILCVLGGVGIVRLAELAGPWLSDRVSARSSGGSSGGSSARSPARLSAGVIAGVVAAVLIAVSIPFTLSRANDARAAEPIAAQAVTRLNELSAAVAAIGGHDAAYPCKTSFTAVNHGVQTALAWKLGVTLEKVGTSMHDQGLMFVGPHDSIDGGPPAVSPRLNQKKLIGEAGGWEIYRMSTAGLPQGCVGR